MNEYNQEANLKDYLKIIVNNKRFIIFGTILCAAAAAAASLIMPQTYQSSLILEVGKIYLPPREQTKQEVQYIEEPNSTARVIESEEILDRVRQELNLDITLKKMREQLEIVTFEESVTNTQQMISPLVKAVYNAHSPSECVEVLNAIASIIVKQQSITYHANREALENRGKNLQEKVTSMEEVLAAQSKYRNGIQTSIEAADKTADEFGNGVSELDRSNISPVELLFLQSSSSAQRKSVTDMSEIVAELDVMIGENKEKLGDFKDEIVNIQSLSSLSTPTRVRSSAVLPDRPISPDKVINTVVGGILGLVFTILFSFFRVYWKDN